MKVCGLTGGVGMGKTTIAQLMSRLGVQIIDSDDLARQLVEPGQPALAEIQTTFGGHVITSNGRLQRDELARIVFADVSARQKLENILHPRIRSAWMAQIELWRQQGQTCALVVIPLLFETQAESHFEKIICAACLPGTQQIRLAARKWTPRQISERLAAQWPIAEKIARSNHVIWTEGMVGSTEYQVQRIVERL